MICSARAYLGSVLLAATVIGSTIGSASAKEPFDQLVSAAKAEMDARQGVVHFGIDSMRPGPEGDVNALVHKACLDLDITHIESLCSLEALLGQGRFTFIGLPMKWRGGTASPIRAVAVFDM